MRRGRLGVGKKARKGEEEKRKRERKERQREKKDSFAR